MIPEQLKTYLETKFPQINFSISEIDKTLVAEIEKDSFPNFAEFLKNSSQTTFDYLMNLTAVDYPDKIEVIYHIFSMIEKHKITVKTKLDRINPEINSIAYLWSGADWFEREVFDLFGVKFLNHPNLQRIVLPPEWAGYPLRKDYQDEDFIKKPW
jgi:NADH-quinone oxidoreductase subunit C